MLAIRKSVGHGVTLMSIHIPFQEEIMPLIGPKEMFAAAYKGQYAVGAFNVNNMEIVQGIMQAASEEKSPVILQVSAGARKYAGQT